MADVRDLTVRINGDASGYSKAINEVGGASSKAEGSIANFTKAFVFGNVIFSLGTDIAIRFKDALGEANKEADTMEASQVQLAHLLKQTHDASGQSVESLNKMAESIAKTTPVSKAAALGAEQMLLPFTNISKQVFPGVLQASTDLATHLNHGLAPSEDQVSSAAKQLGRAFNDPAAGLALLKRAGISLTTTQVEQIKTMQKQGDLLGAQKLLLQDLSNTMGGSAVASAKTFSGQMTMLKNTLVDFAASGIMRAKQDFSQWAQDIYVFSQTRTFHEWMTTARDILHDVANVFNSILKPALTSLWDTVSNNVIPAVRNLINALEPGLNTVLKIVAVVAGSVLVGALYVAINAIKIAIDIITFIVNVIANLIRWLGNAAGAVINFASTVISFFQRMLGDVQAVMHGVENAVSGGIQRALGIIHALEGDFASAGAGLIHALEHGIESVAEAPVHAVEAIAGKIRNLLPHSDAKEGPLSTLTYSGRKLSETFAAGIAQSGGSVYNAVSTLAGVSANTLNGIGLNGQASAGQPSVASMPSASSTPTATGNTFIVNVGMYAGMPVEKRQIALELYKELVRAARAQGVQMQMIGAMSPQ